MTKRPTPHDPKSHLSVTGGETEPPSWPPLLPDGAGAHGVSFSASSDGVIPTPISCCAAIVVKTGNVGEGKSCSGDFFLLTANCSTKCRRTGVVGLPDWESWMCNIWFRDLTRVMDV